VTALPAGQAGIDQAEALTAPVILAGVGMCLACTDPDQPTPSHRRRNPVTADLSALGREALAYAAIGGLVFPLAPRGKLPAIANPHPAGSPERATCRGECGLDGHGLRDGTTDPDRIVRWWTRWPAANIGLRTGVGFDVLDVDGEEGDRALGAIARQAGDLEMRTDGPMAETAHGSHLFFAATGAGNRAGLVPKVDWRGAGGYVAAAPSIHPSGHRYAWLPGLGPDTPLEPPPSWLLQLVLPPAPVPGMPPALLHRGGRHAYGRRALEAEVGRLALAQVGTRNHALNSAAFSLGQLVAGGELDPSEVAGALLTTAVRIGLTGPEAEATISSGMRRGLELPRSRPA